MADKIKMIVLLVVLNIVVLQVNGQTNKLPPFAILQTNGKVFNAHQLPVGKPIVVVYFSPECDHCHALLNEYCSNAKLFSGTSVAMVTFAPIAAVKKVIDKYKLYNHPNVYVGTEGNTFFLRKYYGLTETPFVALYNKNGDLIKRYNKNPDMKVVGLRIKHL